MPGSRLNVHLFRDSFNTPWGFRLQGGKDLNQPLTVQRVFSNSPAEGELQRGDVILSINNRDTSQLTHKQAQDLIKHGGGQVQLVINRLPPGVHVGPLSPPIVTQRPRAPSLQANLVDRSHTLSKSTLNLIEQDHADRLATGPVPKVCCLRSLEGGGFDFESTSRSATLPRRFGRRSHSQSAGSQHTPSYGFQPSKVSQNKYGGGGPDFGSDFSPHVQTPAQRYEPRHDKSGMLNRLQSSLDNLTLSPRSPEVHMSSPFYQPYEQPYRPPVQVYTPTGLLLEQQRLQESQEEGEVINPVWERRKHFLQGPSQASAVRTPANKPHPKVLKPRPGTSSYGDLGTDYSQPSSKQAQSGWRPAPKFKPTPAPVHYAPKPAPKYSQPAASFEPVHSTPPAWQRQEQEDTGTPAWRNTLKTTGVKPWEADASYSSEQAPVRSVPYTPTPAKSPISPGPYSPAGAPHVGGSENGPKVVHLQYNSPFHLYSNQNVAETLKGQTQAVSGQTNRPAPPSINESGDRDWSQSAVLRFLNQEDTKKSRQEPPSIAPKPLFSPVQAPGQSFYQDTGASEF